MKPFLKYGLIVGAAGIVLSMISYLLGLDKTDAGQYIGWLNIPIIVIAMAFAIKEKREKEFGGFIEFGQAFSTGALIVLVASAISSVYTYFYMSFINPSIREYIAQKQMEKLEEQGLSQDKIDASMSMMEKFSTPAMSSVFVFFGGLVMGIIVALIVAAIMKKSNPNPFDTPASTG